MKIWKQFNSSHSLDISVIGTFRSTENAEAAFDIVEDFTLGSWQTRYETIAEFNQAWIAKLDKNLRYSGITDEELDMGIDAYPDITIDENKISIEHLRTDRVSGLIKLFRYLGAANIVINEDEEGA